MKIRKSLIAGVTAATVTACLAAPAQAETHTPTTQVQAAETPNTKSPLGSVNTIWENTPAWLRLPLFAPLALIWAVIYNLVGLQNSTGPSGSLPL
ncbi:hypothetical protein [uncultured Corynebacterium sp.]|uniref:hypothetical protein n=1 Tax=uncultured Corynebacterium sp. TaxID=159447 RepID=UPI0025DAAE4C|nr:hypothetical protein [uncultured Corynebacterium sp.]